MEIYEPRQTDFPRLVECIDGEREECAGLVNLPAIQGGQAIFRAIERLTVDVRGIKTTLRTM